MATTDFQATAYDWSVDPVFRGPADNRTAIYLFWHEYLLLPYHVRPHGNMSILISQHRDASLLAYAAGLNGYTLTKGSTTRGSRKALRKLMRTFTEKNQNIGITPDGPKGPRRVLAQGPVYLSSKLQVPIVLAAYGVDKAYRFRSWDRFAIPYPASRVRLIYSPRFQVPRRVTNESLENWRVGLETVFNTLSHQAESWAKTGGQYEEQRQMVRESSFFRKFRPNSSSH
ncbi:MAG: lysophospholipid acyltransferase family protein [Pirellulaceae bacterium]|nr:lysophospholipid acyltransferase family protein [Pirellulaceae bacterium]